MTTSAVLEPELQDEPELTKVVQNKDGTARLELHFHPGQLRAWESKKRIILVLAGTQGGKTSFGPHWLYREICNKGPGDYMIVTPTFQLLELKALPEFQRLFEDLLHLGKYVSSPSRKFVFSESGARRTFEGRHKWRVNGMTIPTRVLFGYADDPESLESATAKAAWLDEAGQKKFRLGSWESIRRRLSLARGRILITTTPYDLGWLKQKIFDKWKKGGKKEHPEIDVIRFDSTENPVFPMEEFLDAKANMPRWKFNLFYRAIFTRPAGLIYDSFDERTHKIPRFKIPPDWPRFLGLDFGGVNTAALFFAEETSTRRLYLYREYKAGGRTAKEHAEELKSGEVMVPQCVGGSKSEGQWRQEFRAGGLPVMEPVTSDVEVGIDRVYGCHKRGELYVFDDLDGYLEEKQTYSRRLDEDGEPTEEIEDKSTFHFMDAERYILGWLRETVELEDLDEETSDALANFRGT